MCGTSSCRTASLWTHCSWTTPSACQRLERRRPVVVVDGGVGAAQWPTADDRSSATGSASGCLSCVVVSDAGWVGQCASQALHQPILTAGVARHLAASPKVTDQRDVLKLFLDWFLLAQSRALLSFGSSSFAGTAHAFAAASSAAARRVDFAMEALLSSRTSAVGSPGPVKAANAQHQDMNWWWQRCSPSGSGQVKPAKSH